jgi:hypothetical protein
MEPEADPVQCEEHGESEPAFIMFALVRGCGAAMVFERAVPLARHLVAPALGVVGGLSRHRHVLGERAGRHASTSPSQPADRVSSHLRSAGARH